MASATTSEPEKLKEEGLRLFQDGAYAEAIENFNHAHRGFMDAGQNLDAAEMLNNIGVIYRIENQLPQAAEKLEAALKIFEESGDLSRAAQTLGNLAPLYNKQGATDKALATFTRAAEIFEELGDRSRRGEILMAKGVLMFDKGQRAEGLGAYENGLMLLVNPTGK